MSESPGFQRRPRAIYFLAAFIVLAAVLGFLFRKSFQPEMVLFSNDAPLGIIQAEAGQAANESFLTGYWNDLNWVGMEQPAVSPGLSWLAYWMVFKNPVWNAKFYGPISLLILGLSAWFFFRQLGFRNVVCVLGGLAAALNMNTFSHVCWGLPSRAMAQAAVFLALAALQSAGVRHFWIKAVLGGMAVGLAVMEAFDVGALYSLYVAAFAVFIVLINPGSTGKKVGRSLVFVGVVALCAAWFAAYTLTALIGTQIQGVAGSKQDEMTRQERWDYATWWSLPKIETLRVLIPGLYGYRMDTEGGGNYWGRVGEQPGLPRHSGAGEYAGVLVILVGAWAAANGFRKKGGPFSQMERYQILFWTFAGLISILYAWGRHAPFYQIIYWLPYFSTIRNPIKFMHFFHLSMLILFAFGLEGMFRLYIASAASAKQSWSGAIKGWWKNAGLFDRRWVYAAGGVGLVAALGFMIYVSSRTDLEQHLRTAGFPGQFASEIARFSFREVGLFVLFYVVSFAALILVQSGVLAGARWKFATALLGGILLVDLARANLPWIVHYDYKARYASGPLFDLLARESHEQRVTGKWYPFSGNYLVQDPQLNFFSGLQNNWLQNQYQFYNISSIEVIQFPRIPILDETFIRTFSPTSQSDISTAIRLWQLTSTRTILAQRGFEEALNRAGFGSNSFRLQSAFSVVPRPNANRERLGADDLTTELTTNGPFAVIEFTNSLPRVKLFSHWEIEKDDQRMLSRLRDPAFDPMATVLVSEDIAAPSANPFAATATAAFVKYSPKDFSVKTDSAEPGLLLVTDKYSPNWKVYVDGKEEKLLRANYLLRGVQVPSGSHTVEFKYRPNIQTLYVTLSAILVGLGLCGFLAFSGRRQQKA